MGIRLSGRSGFALVAAVLFVPAILVAYFLHSGIWLIMVPLGIIAFVLLVAALPSSKREVTPEQFANELERHLLGTEGDWDWDDTTSVTIADERLERIRRGLAKFDSLEFQKDKDELQALVDALRRGELPEADPSKHLS